MSPVRTSIAVAIAMLVSVSATARRAAPAPKPVEATAIEKRDSDIIVTGAREKQLTPDQGSVGILGNVDVLDAPYSVQSFSEALIRDTQAITLSDILQRDASFSINGSSSRASPWDDTQLVRGFEITTYNSVSISGLFGLAYLSPALESVDRVDLLKGPNAFLTGAPGSVGGTVALVLKRSGDMPLTRAGATYLSDAIFGGEADVSRRLGAFGVRVSGGYRKGRVVYGDGHLKRGNVAVALTGDLGPIAVGVDLLHQYSRSSYGYYVSLADTYPIKTGLPAKMDGRDGTQPDDFAYYSRSDIVIGHAEWAIAPGWSASAAFGKLWGRGGYTGYCFNLLRDRGGTVDCYSGNNDGKSPADSGDLRLNGGFATGPLTHKLVLGVNRIHTADNYRSSPTAPVYVFNIYDGTRPQAEPLAPYGPFFRNGRRTFKSLVVGDTIGVADDLMTLTVGARRADIRTKSYVYGTGILRSQSSGAKWTPTIAATIQPNDRLTLYGNYIEALEPGAVAPVTAANAGEAFPPFVSRQIEFGAKARVAGLTATAAWFRIRRASGFLSAETNPRTFVADGLQQNQGVELSLNGAVTKTLRIVTSASRIDARLKETGDPALDGNHVPAVPRWGARALVEWDVSRVPGLTLIGGVGHSGRAAFDSLNSFDVPGYTKWEGGTRYAFRAGDIDIVARLSIDNLTQARYWNAGYDGGIFPAVPRTAALSLSADF